jgi:6-phosphogluconolactonase
MKLTCVLFCLLLVWRAEADKTVYIGGYDKVITVLNLNTTAQQFQLLYQVPALQNPCFLVMDPSKKYLYAVSEVEEYDGKKTGAIVAYNVDPTSKILTPLNARDSLGGGPVTLQVSKDSKYMLVANYMGPTFAVFELAGRIGNSTFVQENKGHGPNPERKHFNRVIHY